MRIIYGFLLSFVFLLNGFSSEAALGDALEIPTELFKHMGSRVILNEPERRIFLETMTVPAGVSLIERIRIHAFRNQKKVPCSINFTISDQRKKTEDERFEIIEFLVMVKPMAGENYFSQDLSVSVSAFGAQQIVDFVQPKEPKGPDHSESVNPR